jgi:hypothetical protein
MALVNKNLRHWLSSVLKTALDTPRNSAVAEVRSMLDAQWEHIPDNSWLRMRVDKGTGGLPIADL